MLINRGKHPIGQLEGAQMRRLYGEGYSIREIMKITSRSYQGVRTTLISSAVQLRSRGGANNVARGKQ